MQAMTEREKAIALEGGLWVDVSPAKPGRVLARQVPLSAVPQFFALLDDEALLIEFVCQQAAGWADTLGPDAVDAIMEAMVEVNRPILARRVRRRAQLIRALTIESAPPELMNDSTSPISPPTASWPSAASVSPTG